jgi:hypothetical protein
MTFNGPTRIIVHYELTNFLNNFPRKTAAIKQNLFIDINKLEPRSLIQAYELVIITRPLWVQSWGICTEFRE